MLNEGCDWSPVAEVVAQPGRFTVLDDVLTLAGLARVRAGLLEATWTERGFPPGTVSVRYPDAAALTGVVEQITRRVRGTDPSLVLSGTWAFMYQAYTSAWLHVDDASVSFVLWLTPNQYHRSGGGLTVYDLALPAAVCNSRASALAYFEQHWDGRRTRIGYRCNRAVVFDARLFHGAEPGLFLDQGLEGRRLVLSIFFTRTA
jgi:hypothetical protein